MTIITFTAAQLQCWQMQCVAAAAAAAAVFSQASASAMMHSSCSANVYSKL
jgi:hypothetical protein